MLKQISRNLLLAALIVCACAPNVGASSEAEYHAVVKLVESYYHAKHRGVPTLATLGLKAAKVVSSDARRVMRFGDFKLAIFEDQDFNARDGYTEFHRLLRQTLLPGWEPLLAVRARDEGQTYTFTKPDGDKYKVLIIALAQRDGTVLQVNLDRDEFAKLLQDPEQETRNITDEAATANKDNDQD
ncbi:MAG TPA: hypothetical protein VE775_01525 [Pyrinomonadaceae bacterium]|nr:hypothetical protein [Pyrinomonadaceae bacterium]